MKCLLVYFHLLFVVQHYTVQGWKEWSSWSRETGCSVSCGQGSKYQKRYCKDIAEQFINSTYRQTAKSGCDGSRVKSTPCFEPNCPLGEPSCNCGCKLSNDKGVIRSRVKHRSMIQCTWSITTKVGSKVKLRIEKLSSGSMYTSATIYEQPEIIIAQDNIGKFPITIESHYNKMNISVYYHEALHVRGGIEVQASYEAIAGTAEQSSQTADSPVVIIAISVCGAIILIAVLIILYRKCSNRNGERTDDTLEEGAEDNYSSASSSRSSKHKQQLPSSEEHSLTLLGSEKRLSITENPLLMRGYPDGREVFMPSTPKKTPMNYADQQQPMMYATHQPSGEIDYRQAIVQPNLGYMIKQGQLPFSPQGTLIMQPHMQTSPQGTLIMQPRVAAYNPTVVSNQSSNHSSSEIYTNSGTEG